MLPICKKSYLKISYSWLCTVVVLPLYLIPAFSNIELNGTGFNLNLRMWEKLKLVAKISQINKLALKDAGSKIPYGQKIGCHIS